MGENLNTFDESENFFSADENKGPDTEIEEAKFELPHRIELEDPVILGDKKEIKELIFSQKFKEKMGRHLPVDPRQIKRGHFGPIIAGMTGQPLAVIGELTAADLAKCYEVAGYFLGLGSV